MWIQLEPETFEQLAVLAETAKLSAVAERLRYSISLQNDGVNFARKYRRKAQEVFGKEGELEFDEDAVVSRGDDDGAYVMAWQWIPATTLPRQQRK